MTNNRFFRAGLASLVLAAGLGAPAAMADERVRHVKTVTVRTPAKDTQVRHVRTRTDVTAMQVKSRTIALRTRPSKYADVVDTAYLGARMNIVSIHDGWAAVRTSRSGLLYVPARYLEPVQVTRVVRKVRISDGDNRSRTTRVRTLNY